MATNSEKNENKTQDTSTTPQDKNSTDNTWNLAKARAFAQELLKDIPSAQRKGSVIIPVKKR
jgi:hypothetical protein